MQNSNAPYEDILNENPFSDDEIINIGQLGDLDKAMVK